MEINRPARSLGGYTSVFKLFSKNTSPSKMAGTRFSHRPMGSSVSFYTAGWDIEQAMRLIDESLYLNPQPTVMFVRPPANQFTFALDRQETEQTECSDTQAKASGTNMSTELPRSPRRMARVLTTEDFKRFTDTGSNRKKTK